MEMNQVEVKTIAEVSAEAQSQAVFELAELQFALVGGGCGEVVLA